MNQFSPLPIERQGQKIFEFLPVGKAWDSATANDKNFGKLLQSLGIELYRLEVAIEILSIELDINKTNQLIREWEISVGIPDSCFDGAGDLESRRQAILTKIQNIRLQTAEDFENLALTFGQTVRVTGGANHGAFPTLFPIHFFASGQDARFTMIVDSESNRLVFGLEFLFPIQFTAGINGVIECLFRKLKPANCDILFRYNNPQTPVFSPENIFGLQLWLDANDSSTITENSGDVSEWRDKSSNQNNAQQLDNSIQPVFLSSGIDGKGSLEFFQTLPIQYMTLLSNIAKTDLTAIAVFVNKIKSIVSGVQVGGMILNGPSTVNNQILRYDPDIGDDGTLFTFDGNNPGIHNLASSFTDIPIILMSEFDTSDLLLGQRISLNGVLKSSAEYNGTIEAQQIGRLTTGGTLEIVGGLIGELIVYDRILVTNEIQAVNDYLSNKWNIALG